MNQWVTKAIRWSTAYGRAHFAAALAGWLLVSALTAPAWWGLSGDPVLSEEASVWAQILGLGWLGTWFALGVRQILRERRRRRSAR